MTHHYFTRSPSIAAELDARGMFPCDYLTHSDYIVGSGAQRRINFDAIHRMAAALSARGDANGLFVINGEWQDSFGPFWCDPHSQRTTDFTRIEQTAQDFRDMMEVCRTHLTCPYTMSDCWLLPAWYYRGGDPEWRRAACTAKGVGLMDGATAVFCQVWADDADTFGYHALASLRRNLTLSDFWDARLSRHFQLCPYTKGTATTPGNLLPSEYTREAVRMIEAAGHNVVWFLPQMSDNGRTVRSETVEATSDVGRAVLARLVSRVSTPSGGGVA